MKKKRSTPKMLAAGVELADVICDVNGGYGLVCVLDRTHKAFKFKFVFTFPEKEAQ